MLIYTTCDDTPLDAEQIAAVLPDLAAAAKGAQGDDPWFDYQLDGVLVQRCPPHGRHVLAVFESIAYEVWYGVFEHEGDTFDCVPVLVDGHAIIRHPKEGARPEVLHLFRTRRHDGHDGERTQWDADWLYCGWLFAAEVNQTREETEDRFMAEIDAGYPHITGGVPGWD